MLTASEALTPHVLLEGLQGPPEPVSPGCWVSSRGLEAKMPGPPLSPGSQTATHTPRCPPGPGPAPVCSGASWAGACGRADRLLLLSPWPGSLRRRSEPVSGT